MGNGQMHFGVSMFHTDYSIPAVQLARPLEERGFESMWAPEYSHIPMPRRTPFPGGGEVPKPYYEVMDSADGSKIVSIRCSSSSSAIAGKLRISHRSWPRTWPT